MNNLTSLAWRQDWAPFTKTISLLSQVLPTKKPGYYLLTWSEHGLELKRRWEEKQASQQACGGASKADTGPAPIFERLIGFTEEIEHEGKMLQVISPYKIRLLEEPAK